MKHVLIILFTILLFAPSAEAQVYKEPRFYVEAQWWDSTGANRDLRAAGTSHIHLGAMVPLRVSGDLVLDFVLTTFHVEGSLRLLAFDLRRAGADLEFHQDFRIKQEIEDPHLFTTAAPRVSVDTTKLSADGWWQWAMTLTARLPKQAGLPKRNVLMRIVGSVYVDNGKDVLTSQTTPVFTAQGTTDGLEVDPIELKGGYRSVDLLTPPDPVTGCFPEEIRWTPRTAGGAPIHAFATRNPNMHSHPPDLGATLFDSPAISNRTMTLYWPGNAAGPQRLFLRADDSPAFNPHTAAAVLVVRGNRCLSEGDKKRTDDDD